MHLFGIYAVAGLIITTYGGQICPFLETLSLREWGTPVMVGMAGLYGLRALVMPRLCPALREDRPDQFEARTRFVTELTPFFLLGLALAVFNSVYFGFPLFASGIVSVLLAAVLVGVFSAMHLTLVRERAVITALNEQGQSLKTRQRFVPMTRRIALVVTLVVGAMAIATLTVIGHDLDDTIVLDQATAGSEERRVVMLELAFIMATFLAITLDLVFAYSRNLRLLFSNEIRALQAVDKGNLERPVSIATNDEFGTVAEYTNRMIQSLTDRTEQLQRTQDVTIRTLASLAETRDNETGAHIVRTQNYVCLLARALMDKWQLSEKDIENLYKSAPLHDIGKVGIPDSILLKPGPLTEDEWQEMRQHPVYGARALEAAESELGGQSFLTMARELTRTHHEKWDGTGYPAGLAGTAIPRAGRLMALADVYDALISARVYKPAFSHEKARGIIVEGRGVHFDPEVVDAFLDQEAAFEAAGFRQPLDES